MEIEKEKECSTVKQVSKFTLYIAPQLLMYSTVYSSVPNYSLLQYMNDRYRYSTYINVNGLS